MQSSKPAMRVSITGAAGQIGYILVSQISQGLLLGPDQPVILQLIELPFAMEALEGVKQELEDLNSHLLEDIIITSDPKVGFKDADVILLVGARPRTAEMERADLITVNAPIFQAQGKIIEEVASNNVKICVVGNPANTNARILSENCPKVPRANITSLTRLDQNRALSQVALTLKVPFSQVSDVIIWGNHSSSLCIDLDQAKVNSQSVLSVDPQCLGKIEETVQKRGASIIKLRKFGSAISAAQAICNHVNDWVNGSNGRLVSMGVFLPAGNKYGIPSDVNISAPLVCEGGNWVLQEGFQLNEQTKQALQKNIEELNEEARVANASLQKSE